jgi:hypothetical protein
MKLFGPMAYEVAGRIKIPTEEPHNMSPILQITGMINSLRMRRGDARRIGEI